MVYLMMMMWGTTQEVAIKSAWNGETEPVSNGLKLGFGLEEKDEGDLYTKNSIHKLYYMIKYWGIDYQKILLVFVVVRILSNFPIDGLITSKAHSFGHRLCCIASISRGCTPLSTIERGVQLGLWGGPQKLKLSSYFLLKPPKGPVRLLPRGPLCLSTALVPLSHSVTLPSLVQD